MTRYRIAQSAENRNPKSPGNQPRTRGFLQKRLLQTRRSAAMLNGLAVLHGRLYVEAKLSAVKTHSGGTQIARKPAPNPPFFLTNLIPRNVFLDTH
jgi:hypothetical protein